MLSFLDGWRWGDWMGELTAHALQTLTNITGEGMMPSRAYPLLLGRRRHSRIGNMLDGCETTAPDVDA